MCEKEMAIENGVEIKELIGARHMDIANMAEMEAKK